MIEPLLRELAPQVLAILVRRHGGFDRCEDAVQEALLDASAQWADGGLPDNPKAWLVTVAARRWTELWRSETARTAREERAAGLEPPPADADADAGAAGGHDDTLALLLLCCHPALTATSQVALTLRAMGGLTTDEIARALLVPEATVGQRISRAKRTIRTAGARFETPAPDALPARLRTVMHVLYLIFNEGSTASSGDALHRVELSAEAIRLARQLHAALPGDGEAAGLLALMLLTDARRPARTRADGALVPLAEQDRGRWDVAAIAEGAALVAGALARAPLGPYQLQAAIAALHDETACAEDTDWPQILGLYELLRTVAPGPMVSLNWVVAVAEVQGPEVALRALDDAAAEPGLADHHRVDAVRGHLLERLGDREAARALYRSAARRTLSRPERRYLESRAAP